VTDKLVEHYPVKLICQTLGYPRSAYYYAPKPRDESDDRAAIAEVAGQWPTYGYRRITPQLRRTGRVFNSKRVRRLMRLLGLTRTNGRKKRRTTNSDHPFPRYPNEVQGVAVVRPEQVWVADITYIHLRSEYVYLAVIMDVFTRSIRGWHLGRGLDQELTLTALRRALARRRRSRWRSHSRQSSGAWLRVFRKASTRCSAPPSRSRLAFRK